MCSGTPWETLEKVFLGRREANVGADRTVPVLKRGATTRLEERAAKASLSREVRSQAGG